MNLTIIEPHGDDAFISCSSALINPEFNIQIHTMSDRSSEGLKEFYPSVSSTSFIDARDVHYDYHLIYKTHDIHRRYLNGENLYEDFIDAMDSLLIGDAAILHGEFMNNVHTAMIHDESLMPRENSLLILPVGLFHPNHYATRKRFESYIDISVPRVYYVDKPYIEKRYVKEILSTSDFLFYTAPVQNREDRSRIFKAVYPTEQSLLRFSSESILEWKDIYAIRPQDEYNPVILEFLNKVSDMKKGDTYENLVCHAPQD